MSTSADIEMLPAKFGDAFILHCRKGENTGVIIVDGGPNACGRNIVNQFKQIPKIDLMVLSHFDDDHIAGIKKFMCDFRLDPTDSFIVKRFWGNCAKEVPVATSTLLSNAQASNLSFVLNEIANTKNDFEWKENIIQGNKYHFLFADIYVLSPNKEVLMRKKEEFNVGKNLLCSRICDADVELDGLQKEAPKYDANKINNSLQDLTNKASISFLLKCDRFSILMLGDAYPDDVIQGLQRFGYSEKHPLSVDYVKLSHHGSCYNISPALLKIVRCDKFLVSTNGGKGTYHHPDRLTLALIACAPTRDFDKPIHFYFNYSKKDIECRKKVFLSQDENENNIVYHFNTHNIYAKTTTRY